MACLGSVLYDPAAVATALTDTSKAMTAFDTTNASITFTAPANGIVLVKIRAAYKGAGAPPYGFLGVLDGATVRARQVPMAVDRATGSTTVRGTEAVFLVTGLTPGNSYTFDAAYGVETAVASSAYGWGGPNNTTLSDAYGALSFEVWETTNLLGGILYDPAVAVTKATTSLLVMTALDTTNLRIAFTVPASGRVFVRLRGGTHGATTQPAILLGVLEGSTIKMRLAPFVGSQGASGASTDIKYSEASAVIDGLTPAASLTWDAAYGVETVAVGSGLKYGGPNNATANDAFGGFTFEVWEA
jgi:hypothetical protein